MRPSLRDCVRKTQPEATQGRKAEGWLKASISRTPPLVDDNVGAVVWVVVLVMVVVWIFGSGAEKTPLMVMA